jgi:riboflavin kinase/FMN adenylyltransferase
MRLVRVSVVSAGQVAPCALALGNFDGVHLGHRHVIQAMQDHAAHAGLVPSVGFLEPHPHQFFNHSWSMLTPLRLKLCYLAALRVEQVVIFRFNAPMAELSPQAFMRMLSASCHAKALVVGEDFRFGAKRAGDIVTLQDYPGEVLIPPQFLLGPERVSSSACRRALALAEFSQLAALLGRPYTWMGRFEGQVGMPLHPAQAMPPEGRYQVAETAAPVIVKAGRVHCTGVKSRQRVLTLSGWSKL